MNGGELVVRVLEDLGVEYIFGYIGATVAPIFDALITSSIKLINSVDEVGAAHMADGYARASGKPGVVLATSGPGATNLVTGIATAYMDSVPMLAITANVPAVKLGKDSFQEVDITGIVTPVTKYSEIVKTIDSLEYVIRRGYMCALSGRQAPVLIDITSNVLTEEGVQNRIAVIPQKSVPVPNDEEIALAGSTISSSQRPIVLLGGGSKGAEKEILKLAERIGAPTVSTMRSAGAINSERYIGTVGSAAPMEHNKLYRRADLVVAFGTRFSDRQHSKEVKGQKHIHIDIDKAELNKIVIADVALNGNSPDVAKRLFECVAQKPDWFNCEEVSARKPVGRLGRLAEVISTLALRNDIALATDVGVHQVAILNALRYIPQHLLITASGLGTMGFGVGGAIGAHFGSGKSVLLVTGDGGFNMCSREIATAVKYAVPLTVIVVNNHSLKMIADLQNKEFGGRHIAIDTPKISYKLLAKSMGANYKALKLVDAYEELTGALTGKGVCVYEFLTR